MVARKALFCLVLVYVLVFSLGCCADNLTEGSSSKLVLFYMNGCPHCEEEQAWLDSLIVPKYPDLIIERYEISRNPEIFTKYCTLYNTTCSGVVPRTFVGGKVFVGFAPGEGDLIYNQQYGAYVGRANQIENAILTCLGKSCKVAPADAVTISKGDPQVSLLVIQHPNSYASSALVNHTYLIGWWTPERLASKLYYPDLLVYVDADKGTILRTIVPTERVPFVEKPVQHPTLLQAVMFSVIALYLLAYLLLKRRARWPDRFWLAGFFGLVIILVFILALTTPEYIIERYARGFPFPVFVFLIALADGFNPCAFTVLIVLLSLLTHTKSRRKMAIIGVVFIATSALMYFLFIIIISVLIGTIISAGFRDLIFKIIGLVVVAAGLINLKDFFFFKKGISLGISDEHRGRIFKDAGRIVRRVDKAADRRQLVLALAGTVVLASFVNLVEFGCTALFPTIYTAALFSRYGPVLGFYHFAYTVFYSVVYVFPLLAILGNFLLFFKSERLSERQARILKLVGGLLMVLMGGALLLNLSLPAG